MKDDLSAAETQLSARRYRERRFSADFHAEGDAVIVIGKEKTPEGNIFTEETDGADFGSDPDAGSKPPAFR